jgi:rhodanese-related sulfurtransferase
LNFKEPTMHHFTPQQLQSYLTQAESAPLLLDVREPWEFAICRIEGSLNIPMGHIPQSLDKLKSDRETVVICHHGIRSAQVGFFLIQAGFERIVNLTGGIDAWSREVDPKMPHY